MSNSCRMLWRFSLYGFLKNQQYYEPFLMLALFEKDLAFTAFGVTFQAFTVFGLLIGFREVMINLMEIPSGVVSDVFGHRRSMIFSFCAYIASFALFGLVKRLPLLFLAMFFFAIGDAFRTGTHKAMIFNWLRMQGRTDERTKVYGYTRSWSKIGSAVSTVLAAALVLTTGNYLYVFLFAIVPYILNIVNVVGYPKALDGEHQRRAHPAALLAHFKHALALSVRRTSLRRLILESMGFEGFFAAIKDYPQKVLESAAVPLIALLVVTDNLDDKQKSALLIGPVYFVLFLLSALASRKAHVLVNRIGNEQATARFLWGVMLVVFVGLLPAMLLSLNSLIVVGFIALYVAQNFWRPVLISRFDAHSEASQGATMLSIESQAKSVATMLFAPLIGWAIDASRTSNPTVGEFWPIGAVGLVLALGFFVTARSDTAT